MLLVWNGRMLNKSDDLWQELEMRKDWFEETLASHWLPTATSTADDPMPFLYDKVPSQEAAVDNVESDNEDQEYMRKTESKNYGRKDLKPKATRPLCNGRCKRAAVVQMSVNKNTGLDEIDLLQGHSGPFLHRPDCHLFHVSSVGAWHPTCSCGCAWAGGAMGQRTNYDPLQPNKRMIETGLLRLDQVGKQHRSV